MNTTTNYGLGKPLESELYEISVQNTNMDIVDTSLKSVSNTANSASSGVTTHTANKSNPHAVTKAQVGLSNVPNVSTNNQTPSYSVPSALSALVSGEILQTAFGKIAKAVSDLISHIANVANPHSVTKSQVGLSNVDNVKQYSANNPQTSVTGNAATATRLATSRNIALTGDITGTASFNGSANASIATSFSDDTGWRNLTLNGNVELYVPNFPVKYRRKNGIVYVKGRVTNITAASTVIGTLPVGFRPIDYSLRFSCAANGNISGRMYVNESNGTITIENFSDSSYPAARWLSLNEITFCI